MTIQWIIKRFMKKKAVRVYLLTKDNRLRHYWTIPDSDGTITVGEWTFLINKDHFITKDNVPTLFCTVEDAESINIKSFDLSNDKDKKIFYTAENFKTAIHNKVTKEILESSKGSVLTTDTLIILGVVTICTIILGFYLGGKLDTLMELYNTLSLGE